MTRAVFLLVLVAVQAVSLHGIQLFSWKTTNSISPNDLDANFHEYSDDSVTPTHNQLSAIAGDFEQEPPTAAEAELMARVTVGANGAAESQTETDLEAQIELEAEFAVPGARDTDEFNPETMFQDQMADDAKCINFPNQTMIKPHFFSCNSPVRPPILVVHDSAVANATGDYQFPLDFTQTVRFFFDVTSFATRRYDNLRAEVYIYRRKSGWLGCGWLFLPTFGIIDNYDVCEDNLSCPVYPGRQVIEVSINPKVAFSGIFKMIHNKDLPYQVIIRLVNNRPPTEELMCVVYQSRIDF